MPAAPLVSVLLAVSNGERYLRAALESILRQTVSDLELIVVDDGSTDETPEILGAVDDARLRVLRNEERRGLAASLNRGLDEARGRYVARLDADDIAFPRRLERQLSAHGRIGLLDRGSSEPECSTSTPAVGRNASHLRCRGAAGDSLGALFSAPVLPSDVLVDRDVLERHGLRYDTEYRESEDYDLWTRLLDVSRGDNSVEPARPLSRCIPDRLRRRGAVCSGRFSERVSLREIAASRARAGRRACRARAAGRVRACSLHAERRGRRLRPSSSSSTPSS